MNAAALVDLVAGLDGRPMRTLAGNWAGTFDGAIDVAGLRQIDDRLLFTLTVPTGPSDRNDFISGEELDSGTTAKLQIVSRQDDGTVSAPLDLVVRGVLRTGPEEPEWVSPTDAYVFRVELGPVAHDLWGPLVVRLVTGDTVVAEAAGAPTERHGINDVLVPSVITIPLWEQLRHAANDEQFDVVIDVRWDASESPDAARSAVRDLIRSVTTDDAPSTPHAEPAAPRAGGVGSFVFTRLTRAQIHELVARDHAPDPSPVKDGSATPLVHRIWPDFPVQPLLERSIATIKADAARLSFGASGRGVTWAIVDSGVDDHPHFSQHDNLVLPDERMQHQDFVTGASGAAALVDEFGHGTHVGGIFAGERTAESDWPAWACVSERDEHGARRDVFREVTAIRGVAPEAKIVSLRVLDAKGNGPVSRIMEALEYVNDVNENGRVIRIHGVNLSVGYEFDPEWFACGHSPLCQQIDRLVRTGVVVVAAAGNTGYGRINAAVRPTASAGIDLTINDPGNAERAITVGASHPVAPHTYGVSYFSSKGPTGDGRLKPDLLAPGERILSCAAGARVPTPSGDATTADAFYVEDSGTSMAAPHVAGAVAAFLSIRTEFREQPDRIKQLFMDNATDLGRDRSFQGRGLVDLMRVIQSV